MKNFRKSIRQRDDEQQPEPTEIFVYTTAGFSLLLLILIIVALVRIRELTFKVDELIVMKNLK